MHDGTSGRDDFDAVVAEAYRQRVRLMPQGRPPWRLILKPSDVYGIVLPAVVFRHWRRGDRPHRREPPSLVDRKHALELIGTHWPDCESLCAAGVVTGRRVVDDLAGRGISRTPAQISEKICGWLGGHYRSTGAVPAEADQQAAAARIAVEVATHAVLAPLDEQDFPGAVGGLYDRAWAEIGAGHLARFPPSRVWLGADERPPLLRPSGSGRAGADRAAENYRIGLARSVHSRYRLFFKQSARTTKRAVAVPCADHADHEQLRDLDRADPHELAREEVHRTCAPYGLVATDHHTVVEAVSLAFTSFSDSPTRAEAAGHVPIWRDWTADRCAPVGDAGPDSEIARAVRSFVVVWQAGDEGRALVDEHGPLLGQYWQEAVTGFARKVWMELHRREREHVHPMRRRQVAAAIRVGISCGAKDAVRALVDERHLPAAVTGGDTPEEFEQRVDRTAALLRSNQSPAQRWHALAVAGDRSWYPEYKELVAGAPAGQYLIAPELATMLLTLFPEGL